MHVKMIGRHFRFLNTILGSSASNIEEEKEDKHQVLYIKETHLYLARFTDAFPNDASEVLIGISRIKLI